MDDLKELWSWIKSLFTHEVVTPPPAPPVPVQPQDYFPDAIAYVLPNEGGYSNRADDRGGATNFGITIATLSKWRAHPVSVDDVRTMTVDEAKAIYRQWYWSQPGFNLIKNKVIATALLDQGVLDGQATSVACAQRAANNCGGSLKVDGECGPNTRAALEQVDQAKFMNAFVLQLKSRFDAIVANDKSGTQIENYDGWMNRAKRLLTLI